MKILHYMLGLPPVRDGGLIKYALDIIKNEKIAGNEVELLIPGKLQGDSQKKCVIKEGYFESIHYYRIENSLPVSGGARVVEVKNLYQYGDEKVYEFFLKKCRPDIIHVHSFMGLHLACLKAAQKQEIPIVFTTHDYYGLCPKASLLKQGKICTEDNWNVCNKCMEKKASIKKLAVKQSEGFRLLEVNRIYQWMKNSPFLLPLKLHFRTILKKVKSNVQIDECQIRKVYSDEIEQYEKLRNYYREMFACITAFHFNSIQSRNVYEHYLGTIKGKVITISNHMIEDNRFIKKQEDIIKIGFMGHGDETKGFKILKSALDELYNEGLYNFECHIYFNPNQKILPYMKLHMPYKIEQMSNVYSALDLLVMPSICQETFGMVALEALSYGVPVILSKYVGAKDYLIEQPGMGIIVNPVKEELKSIIKELCLKPQKIKEMNKTICAWKHSFSYEEHVQEIIEFYQENL